MIVLEPYLLLPILTIIIMVNFKVSIRWPCNCITRFKVKVWQFDSNFTECIKITWAGIKISNLSKSQIVIIGMVPHTSYRVPQRTSYCALYSHLFLLEAHQIAVGKCSMISSCEEECYIEIGVLLSIHKVRYYLKKQTKKQNKEKRGKRLS